MKKKRFYGLNYTCTKSNLELCTAFLQFYVTDRSNNYSAGFGYSFMASCFLEIIYTKGYFIGKDPTIKFSANLL